MAKKFYAQTDSLGFPIPGIMMSGDKVPVQDNIIEITKEMTLGEHPNGFNYYIRLDEKGDILPNSLFLHYGPSLEEGVLSLQQTPVPAGITVKISSDQMFDPVCFATTTLNIQITSGTSLSDALTITGDFASLGAYYTPVDPGNMMQQPPIFRIAYEVEGILKNRSFKLTGVGVASGADPMFGLSEEGTCPTYWVTDYHSLCGGNVITNASAMVNQGTDVVVGKWYRPNNGTGAYLIKSKSDTNLGMATVLDITTAYDTCTDASDSAPLMGITGVAPASTSAVFTVSITNVDNVGINAAGIDISTDPSFTNIVVVTNPNSTMAGTRTATATGLTASTGYFVRTWIELNSGGDLLYGPVNTLTTLA